MALFYVTVPSKAYEVELRIKELGHPDIYVENGDLEDLNDRFLYDENDIRIEKEPDKFILRCPHGQVWEVTVAEDYMTINNKRRDSVAIKDFDEQIKAEIQKYFLEKHLTDTLESFGIIDAIPSNSMDFRIAQAIFCVPAPQTDEIISRFQFVGIGSSYGSSLTVCNANVYYGHVLGETPNNVDGSGDGKDETEDKQPSKWAADFVKSIKSRLTVAQVVAEIRTNAVLTFDFLLYVNISAFLAVIGLLEDSTVTMVGAMLISPLMGPLTAFTFGSVIRDLDLVKTGGRSEFLGLLLFVVTGFLSGLVVSSEAIKGPWANVPKWPTNSMITYGQLRDLALGACFAVPSGVGLAISILSGNQGSLVGVALAAALMIPAVDCGLFWGIGTMAFLKEGIRTGVWTEPCTIPDNKSRRNHSAYIVNYKVQYCDNTIKEFFALGGVSLTGTFLTLIIIYFVAIVLFKIKEVAPYTTRKSLRRFWKEDLAVARKYNSHKTKTDQQDFRDSLLKEIDDSGNGDEIRQGLDQDYTFRQINKRMGGSGGKAALEDFKLYNENNNKFRNDDDFDNLSRSKVKALTATAAAAGVVNQQGDGRKSDALKKSSKQQSQPKPQPTGAQERDVAMKERGTGTGTNASSNNFQRQQGGQQGFHKMAASVLQGTKSLDDWSPENRHSQYEQDPQRPPVLLPTREMGNVAVNYSKPKKNSGAS